MRSKAVLLAALAAVAVALVVALPANAAGNAGTTQVTTFDPTGAVFTCPGTDYTVLGGTVRSIFHDSFAANGSEHVTGTTSPIGVTLTDGTTLTERVDAVRGTAENPMPREEVVAKARDLIAPVLGSTSCAALIDKVMALESVKDVRELRPVLQRG